MKRLFRGFSRHFFLFVFLVSFILPIVPTNSAASAFPSLSWNDPDTPLHTELVGVYPEDVGSDIVSSRTANDLHTLRIEDLNYDTNVSRQKEKYVWHDDGRVELYEQEGYWLYMDFGINWVATDSTVGHTYQLPVEIIGSHITATRRISDHFYMFSSTTRGTYVIDFSTCSKDYDEFSVCWERNVSEYIISLGVRPYADVLYAGSDDAYNDVTKFLAKNPIDNKYYEVGIWTPGYGEPGSIKPTYIDEWEETEEAPSEKTEDVEIPEAWLDYLDKSRHYVAFGDSYTSGEGAYNYYPSTDTPSNRCHLSTESYPYLLGIYTGADSTHSVACSGAVIDNISGENNRRDSQYHDTSISGELSTRTPGWLPQLKHIRRKPVDVLTIGIGGNDIGFSEKIKLCVDPRNLSTCFSSLEDRVDVATEIHNQFDRLVELYTKARSEVRKKSPTARVYAIGYPKVLSVKGAQDGRCGINVKLNVSEVAFGDNVVDYLNSVIEAASRRAGVTYVDVSRALEGQRLCESNTPAVNGVTAGNGAGPLGGYPIAIESYHPTMTGQRLLAYTIYRKTNGFTVKNLAPDYSVNAPDISGHALIYGALDISLSPKQIMTYPQMSSSIVLRGGQQTISVNSESDLLLPNTSYTVSYFSEPTLVGTFTSDELGSLNITYTVPNSLPIGYHTIHVTGPGADGRQINLRKIVYVGNSEIDLDGDGILNADEICGPVLEPAYEDIDNDGIDDGCDNVIEAISNRDSPENTVVGSTQHPHQSTNYKDSNYKNSEITPPQNIRELLGLDKNMETRFEHSVQNKRQKNAIIFILVLLACAAGATTIVLRHKERNNRNN